jgi:hypothetical protein
VKERIAEIEKAAEADRATIEALRERIQKAGEDELERKRAAALEELDDAEIKLNTGRYATPRFVEPQLEPLPELAFRRTEHTGEGKAIEAPKVEQEPALVMGVVEKLKSPRTQPREWKKWAVRGGIAAVILLTAGSAMMIESRSPDFGTAPRTAQPRPSATTKTPGPASAAPAAPAGGATVSTENGSVDSLAADSARADSIDAKTAKATAGVTRDSSNGAIAVDDSAARARRALARRDSAQRAIARDSAERASERRETARRDSIRRAAAERASASDSNTGAERSAPTAQAAREAPAQRPAAQATRRDDQDLMLLSDSLAKSATPAPAVTPTGPAPGPQ